MLRAWRKTAILMYVCLIGFFGLVIFRTIELLNAQTKVADSILVLGGSPQREILAIKLAIEHPQRKILISSGSPDPCLWLMFNKAGAPKENVWMEHCSQSTFGNFVYSTPILQKWGAKKILLIVDNPQAQRAVPMAQVMLGAKGIAVEPELLPTAGGEEPRYPVYLEELAAICWAFVSQVVEPKCTNVTHLSEVDMKYWYKQGFACQQQCNLSDYKPNLR